MVQYIPACRCFTTIQLERKLSRKRRKEKKIYEEKLNDDMTQLNKWFTVVMGTVN